MAVGRSIARFDEIDRVKAFAILLVVLGHSIQATDAAFDGNPWFRLIYSFHMPLFMFASGFLFAPATCDLRYVAHRFRTLCIPFVLWLLLRATIANMGPFSRRDFGPFLGSVKTAFLQPDNGGLWFLLVLFEIVVIYFSCSMFKSRHALALAWAFGLYVLHYVFHIYPPCGTNLVRWHLPFFIAGAVMREYNAEFRLHKWSVALIVPWVLLEFTWRRLGSETYGLPALQWNRELYNLLVSYLVAFLSIALVFEACRGIRLKSGLVSWLARNTLPVYALHWMIISFGLLGWVRAPSQLATTITFFSAVMLATVATILILQRSALVRRFLFGVSEG